MPLCRETFLSGALGLLAAIVLVELFLPIFNGLAGKQIQTAFFERPGSILTLLGIGIFVGLLAGSYPAFVLSALRPALVLKSASPTSTSGAWIRRGLVVFQFAMSFVLIAGTYAVYSQIDFMLHRNLGMNISQTLVVNGPRLTPWDSTYYDNINSFKAELLRYPAISHVTASGRLPGTRTGRIFDIQIKGGPKALSGSLHSNEPGSRKMLMSGRCVLSCSPRQSCKSAIGMR